MPRKTHTGNNVSIESANRAAPRPPSNTHAPVSMTGRSFHRLSSVGNAMAASMEPPPKAANAMAVCCSVRPKLPRTITTVFTITIEPAMLTTTFNAIRPLRRGVAKKMQNPRRARSKTPRRFWGAEPDGKTTDTTSNADAMKPTTVPESSACQLVASRINPAKAGLTRFSRS